MTGDVLNKKMIFIPVNHDNLHWSLFVVMNATKIEDAKKYFDGDDELRKKMMKKECPIILSLDSLNRRYSKRSVNLIREWLEIKYAELKKRLDTEENFLHQGILR